VTTPEHSKPKDFSKPVSTRNNVRPNDNPERKGLSIQTHVRSIADELALAEIPLGHCCLQRLLQSWDHRRRVTHARLHSRYWRGYRGSTRRRRGCWASRRRGWGSRSRRRRSVWLSIRKLPRRRKVRWENIFALSRRRILGSRRSWRLFARRNGGNRSSRRCGRCCRGSNANNSSGCQSRIRMSLRWGRWGSSSGFDKKATWKDRMKRKIS